MKRRRSLISLLSIFAAGLIVVPLSACAAGPAGSSSQSSIEALAPQGGTLDKASSDSFMAVDPAVGAQSIIYSGDVTLTVSDPKAGAAKVTEITEDLGGYIESQTISAAGDGLSAGATIGVRVPADKIDQAFEELASVGEVISQSRSSNDVTAQHVDLQARVAALEESVTRLTELMSGAATTSELIEAEAALSERQQELDGLRAQLAVLEDQVDDASIWVTLSTQSVIPGGPANFWEGLIAGFASLGTAGAGALVVVGILIPWLILGGLVALGVVLIVRATKKRRRVRQAPTPEQQRIQ